MGRGARQATDAVDDGTAGDLIRTCAVTRAALPPDQLIRFVRGPDGQIAPDLARRLPGRGVWVACARPAIEAAGRRGIFARALRRQVTVPDNLAELVDGLLVRRALEALSLANKAGLVRTGFVKVEAVVVSGECVALVHASDSSDDGAARLDRKFRAVFAGQKDAIEPPIVTCLASAELSLAMGRSNVVHAALTKGGAGVHFLRAAGRLQHYRMTTCPEVGANTEMA